MSWTMTYQFRDSALERGPGPVAVGVPVLVSELELEPVAVQESVLEKGLVRTEASRLWR